MIWTLANLALIHETFYDTLQPKELMSGIEDNAQAHEKAQKIEISNIDLKLPLFFQIVK